MASRKEEGYKDAMNRLEAAGLGDGSVHWLQLDLSDPRLASKSAREFLKREDRLDILSKLPTPSRIMWRKTEATIEKSITQPSRPPNSFPFPPILKTCRGFGPYYKTKDGIQEAMATKYVPLGYGAILPICAHPSFSYLSHFIFAEILLPLMINTSKEEGSDVRILNVSCGMFRSI
jgi:hypothetical protein